MNSSRQILYLDLARIIASVAVVVLHAASFVMTQSNAGIESWRIANILNSFSRWSVPVFIMISGALFLNYSQPLNTQGFYRKRMSRLGIPLLIWSGVYFIWKSYVEGLPINSGFYVQTLVFDQPFIHLYFLFVIGWLYVFTPWLLNLRCRLTLTKRMLVAVALLFVGIFWPPTRFLVTFWVPFIGYYWIGGLLSQVRISSRMLTTSLVLSFVSFALVAIGTHWLTHEVKATHNLFFYDFTRSPLVIIGSLFVFVAIKGLSEQLKKNLKKYKQLLATWASLTLGIYLIHPLVLWVFLHFFSQAVMSFPAMVSISLIIGLIYSASLMLTVLFKRIPYLKLTV